MTPSAEPHLRVREVTVRREGKTLLDRVSLEMRPGDFCMLIGPNGAGKSTLVRAILGLMEYDSGTIELFGMPADDRRARARIGYVPQNFHIERTLPLTVAEFIADYATSRARIAGRPVAPPAAQLAMAEKLGLTTKLTRPIGVLSGGEMQRLLLAAAFLDDPEILFLDEPLAGIDMQGEGDFYSILDEYRAAHPTASFLIVSHDIGVVYQHATRVFCLNRVLHADGPPSEALTHETFEKLYGAGHSHGAHHHHVH